MSDFRSLFIMPFRPSQIVHISHERMHKKLWGHFEILVYVVFTRVLVPLNAKVTIGCWYRHSVVWNVDCR